LRLPGTERLLTKHRLYAHDPAPVGVLSEIAGGGVIGTRVAFRGAFGPHEGIVLEGAAPEVTCAPSAQGMQALLWSWWYRRLFLSDPGPGAFIAETLRCPGQVKRLACRALPAIASWLLLPASAVSRIDSPSPEVLVLFPQADSNISPPSAYWFFHRVLLSFMVFLLLVVVCFSRRILGRFPAL
jgi:hypothetical protein